MQSRIAQTANLADIAGNPRPDDFKRSLFGLLARLDWGKIGIAIGVAVLVAVCLGLRRELAAITWDQVGAAMANVPAASILAAFAATALSYTALVGFDWLALRQSGINSVPLWFVGLTSFIGHAFTFTLGFGVLTGGAVRLRLYQTKGVPIERGVAVGALSAIGFWTGLAAIGGICLLLEPAAFGAVDGLGLAVNRLAGAAVLAVLGGWIAYTAVSDRAISLGGWSMNLPGPASTLGSMLIGMADTGAAALALWFLMPSGLDMSFPGFLVIFVAATILGVVSHVPGGLGVFEAVFVLAVPQSLRADLIGSLLLFRVVYYLVPFGIAAGLLALHEAWPYRSTVASALGNFSKAAGRFMPQITAGAVFVGGFVLILSGALPAEPNRMAALRNVVPLPFVESSHLVASIVGTFLLVIAHGLSRQLRSAWRLSIWLLSAAALFSLAKGFDYEEALICLAVVGLLWFNRDQYYRLSGGLEGALSLPWLVAIFSAAAVSIWAGFWVYQQVGYEGSLWWDFCYNADAPRFLRASLAVSVTSVALILYKFLHQPYLMQEPATLGDNAGVEDLVAHSNRLDAQLAFLGDKRFEFAEGGDGFVMYGVQGSSWIAMGDPIATSEEATRKLIWRYKELADLYRGVAVFYQIDTRYLPVYLDAGFAMAKLGEDAWVDLNKFSLEGSEFRKLRQSKSHAQRAGVSFEIVKAEDIPPLLPELKRVSDAWLAGFPGQEKGFTLGFWSEEYLSRYDHAIVRSNGEIVAFANIWGPGPGGEYSVDLMRHTPDAPGGVMDYLFICLLERLKADGGQWFNLGMAPLSGLPQHRLAPLWSQLASLIYHRGGRFYNFEGLRAFKNKFKPEWRPRYLAYPGGLSLPQILLDATRLISSSPMRARAVKGNAQS